MHTFLTIRQRLAAEFSELYEALSAAQEWIEEGKVVDLLNQKALAVRASDWDSKMP